MTCFIRLSFTRITSFTLSHSDVPSDVTFTVAGGDGDRRSGSFTGQTRLRTGRVPQTVHGRVLVPQGTTRTARENLLLEPEERHGETGQRQINVGSITRNTLFNMGKKTKTNKTKKPFFFRF